MQGDTGCAGFGGEYGYSDGGLTPGEAFGGLAYSGVSINDDSLTRSELAIEAILFASRTVTAMPTGLVPTSGDTASSASSDQKPQHAASFVPDSNLCDAT